MKEIRSQLIGVRFTKKEKNLIKTISDNREIPITEFVREAIFSHINNLQNGIPLEIHFFMKEFEKIKESTELITNSLDKMKKEFNIFDLKQIKKKLEVKKYDKNRG